MHIGTQKAHVLHCSLQHLCAEGYTHHLLHALKERDPPQPELDEAAHIAAYNGHSQCLALVMAAGADPESLNPHGDTLLLEAIHSESIPTIEALVKAGYDVNFNAMNAVQPLHYAIVSDAGGEMVPVLLKAGANPDVRNSEMDTPLIVASGLGLPIIVDQLLLHGCDVSAQGCEGYTALHHAIQSGYMKIIDKLLKKGANPFLQNKAGNSAFMLACSAGNTEIVEKIINESQEPYHPGQVNQMGLNALHCAALSGNSNLVEPLVKLGVDSQAEDKDRNTPLIIAAKKHKEEFALKLCELTDVDVNYQDAEGRTVLHWAAANGLNSLLRTLLTESELDFAACDQNGETPMLLAAKNKQSESVKLLGAYDKDINRQGQNGFTILHWVIIHGDHDLLEELLESETIDINVKDSEGNTPLVLAASLKRYSCMRLLLKKGATPDIRGKNKKMALHWVSQSGYVEMLRMLSPGEDTINAVDADGNTPLLLSVANSQVASAVHLIEAGADVSTTDGKGRNALHIAAKSGLLAVVEAMLKTGRADTQAVTHDGETALLLAAEQGHQEIILMLISHSDVNAISKKQRSTLWYCAAQGLESCVSALLAAGADPDREHSEPSPLIQAAKHGHYSIAQQLVSHGAGINYRDQHRRTAMMWAAHKGHLELVKMLWNTGKCDVNLEDKTSDTALTIATWHEHDDVVEFLAPLSKLSHCEAEEGMDALHLAVAKDNLNCVSVLLQHGACINTVDLKGNTALHSAATHTSGKSILMFLLESGQGFDIDACGDKGRTILHWCVGDPDSIDLVLNYGPNLNILDANGASPILLALAHGQPKSARMLVEAGCDIHLVSHHRDS